MRSGYFEAIWSSLAPLLAKLANCPEGFLVEASKLFARGAGAARAKR